MGRAMATMYIALEAGIGLGAYVSGEIYQGVAAHIPIPFLFAGILSLLAFLLLWKNKKNWTYGI
jgi:predicted MFS family arabinose efflux permease